MICQLHHHAFGFLEYWQVQAYIALLFFCNIVSGGLVPAGSMTHQKKQPCSIGPMSSLYAFHTRSSCLQYFFLLSTGFLAHLRDRKPISLRRRLTVLSDMFFWVCMVPKLCPDRLCRLHAVFHQNSLQKPVFSLCGTCYLSMMSVVVKDVL